MSHVIWSSPIRRSRTVDLSPIPNEIYMEIFSYLRTSDPTQWIDAEERQNFCNLALVCRFFSSVMLPWIFENVKFIEKDSYSQISSTHSSTVSAKFCRDVLDGDTTALLLAKHVKRWAFSGSPTGSNWAPAFLSMYFETLRYTSNLLELSLSNITIPKDLFRRLSGVMTLESLKLDDCSLDETVLGKHLKHFESLSLKQFVLAHPVPCSDIGRLLLHLNLSSLIRLELDIFPRLETLSLSDNCLPLEELYLDIAVDPFQVVKFLEKTPHLNVLRVHCLPSIIDHPFTIKPHVIPRLTNINANRYICEQILPGRPISCLELAWPSTRETNNVETLTCSTKPIVNLKLSWYRDGPPSWRHFPDLESLEILVLNFQYCSWGESVNHAFAEHDRYPDLRSLWLRFSNRIPAWTVDAEEQHVLEFLSTAFPHLHSVHFSCRSSDSYPLQHVYYYLDTWSYTRHVGKPWHRTFRAKQQRYRLAKMY